MDCQWLLEKKNEGEIQKGRERLLYQGLQVAKIINHQVKHRKDVKAYN